METAKYYKYLCLIMRKELLKNYIHFLKIGKKTSSVLSKFNHIINTVLSTILTILYIKYSNKKYEK